MCASLSTKKREKRDEDRPFFVVIVVAVVVLMKRTKSAFPVALWVVEGTPRLLRFAQWSRKRLPSESHRAEMKKKKVDLLTLRIHAKNSQTGRVLIEISWTAFDPFDVNILRQTRFYPFQ